MLTLEDSEPWRFPERLWILGTAHFAPCRWREAARGHRTGHPEEPAYPAVRRGHVLAGLHHRGGEWGPPFLLVGGYRPSRPPAFPDLGSHSGSWDSLSLSDFSARESFGRSLGVISVKRVLIKSYPDQQMASPQFWHLVDMDTLGPNLQLYFKLFFL